ncbi:MAG: hypothetical protein MK141_04065 [Pseudoxanthomonas sp.]|jgi:hypothetical protein|uniref:hypothetical protein n=1 Tax=Pseudoxanthomonas TaxID=83618 RepID=UPI001389E229|nr:MULTISPECIES: hypothetical protein [Pseudoxanthomonas]KAF1725048.1 hypothetical protein CSC76_12790 [Pseudoxanthomonas mexicana]MCH2090742.1 hypothetical protein [Pseudoxanthomonas sp.]
MMEPKEACEAGVALRIEFAERRNALGMGYVQARANFRSAKAPCTVYVVTRELHATPEAAEDEILTIARRQGWGIV